MAMTYRDRSSQRRHSLCEGAATRALLHNPSRIPLHQPRKRTPFRSRQGTQHGKRPSPIAAAPLRGHVESRIGLLIPCCPDGVAWRHQYPIAAGDSGKRRRSTPQACAARLRPQHSVPLTDGWLDEQHAAAPHVRFNLASIHSSIRFGVRPKAKAYTVATWRSTRVDLAEQPQDTGLACMADTPICRQSARVRARDLVLLALVP
jgi:hypothetical protein